ncbi:ArsR/SmtB family transcription factor [Austwickia chelonae]|uniref:Putative ArsR family transcriptional regulator n=1 Tax=Austwickia chelonae NBRC 105200 TaxID=1184607 RepID=K6UNL9_9MICO|nr:metalloregulator ArsR/SmtB family transcription factor [Austwickia chelonae]GAB79081.1 putative ArsR family transcriptional regulator [Austwickia chelonae NBRC 105200]
MSSERMEIASRWLATADLFKVLSAPLRIGIIELLVERPRNVSELVDALGAPQPLISQHLRILRETCLVQGNRSGRETTYSLMDDHVAHIVRDAIAHTSEHDPSKPKETHQPRKDPT